MSMAIAGKVARTEKKIEVTLTELRQRAARAGRWMDGWDRVFRRHIEKDIKRCCAEAAQAVEDGVPWQSLQPRWERRTSELRTRLALSMMPEAYRFCEAMWFGAPEGLQEPHASIEAAFEAEPFLARKMAPLIEGHVAGTVKLEGSQQVAWIALYLHQARDNNLTVAETAAYLVKEADGMAPSRARMLARTTTTWNYSEASSLAYQDYGVQVGEWIATFDELTCPFCSEFDQMKFRLGDAIVEIYAEVGGELVVGEDTLALPYAIYHPPLHPNCRCTIVPDLEHVTVRTPDESTKPVGEKAGDVPLERYGGLTKNQARGVAGRADELGRGLGLDDVMTDEQFAWLQGTMTDDEMDSIYRYVNAWTEMGPAAVEGPDWPGVHGPKMLQALAEQGRPSTKTLWRGMHFDTVDDMDDFVSLFLEESVDMPQLASASLSQDVATDFALQGTHGLLLELQDSGAHLPGFNIRAFIDPMWAGEEEVLLPKGLRLKALQLFEELDPDVATRLVVEVVAE